MFNFLCYCNKTEESKTCHESEQEKEEQRKLLKTFSQSNKYLKLSQQQGELKQPNEEKLESRIEYPKDEDIIFKESWLIRSNEQNIQFSKKGLIELYNSLDKSEGLQKFYEKNNLILYCSKLGSQLTKDFYLGKSFYKMSKQEIYKTDDGKVIELDDKDKFTIEDIKNYMYNPEHKLKWDKSVKSYQVYDTTGKEFYDNSLKDCVYVLYTPYHSPGFFISARDVFFKNIHIYDKNILYCYASSIEEREDSPFYIKETEDYVRCTCYLHFTKYEEDDEYFNFYVMNQTDLKLPLSEKILNLVIPFKMTAFYKEFLKILREEAKIRSGKYKNVAEV